MAASASFSFDEGIRTVSCMATLALRMRVSMSAIGSVIVTGRPPPGAAVPARQCSLARSSSTRSRNAPPPRSPAGLRHAGHLAGMGQLAQADATDAELAVHGVGPPAPLATGVGPHL